MLEGGLLHGVIKRAAERGLIELNCVNIRDFSADKHKRTDDYPYGGGAGMVMTPQPVYDAYRSLVLPPGTPVIYTSPQGEKLSAKKAREWAALPEIAVICGRYEGVDERVIEETATELVSLGDFIMTGGEICAMAVIDAVSRFIPGVLGNSESPIDESFEGGLLEYPQYTRPAVFLGKAVPEVLLSGHHENIRLWRLARSAERTEKRRRG
jgi:tRNA (guanine37-N1)-methyltransferase